MQAPFSSIVPGSVLPPTLRVESELQDLRLDLRQWFEKNDPGPQPFEYEARMAALTRWQRQIHGAGFIGLSWPTEFGGGGMGLTAEAVLCQELAATSMPQLINRLALYTWGPTILSRGTPAQKARFLPGMLDASEIWCQGFSEPDAGSDLTAVRTRAQVSGDVLVVDGQKVWTSRAELSKWNALLVRTDPEGVRHSGLSVLIVGYARAVESVEGRMRWEQRLFVDPVNHFRELPVPTVVLAHGHCLAAGLMFASVADFVYATPDAVFGSPIIPAMSINDAEVPAFAWAVGSRRAKQTLWLDQRMDAQTAREVGLVSEVVAADEIEERIESVVQSLAAIPAETLMLSKLSLRQMDDQASYQAVGGFHFLSHSLSHHTTGARAALAERRRRLSGSDESD